MTDFFIGFFFFWQHYIALMPASARDVIDSLMDLVIDHQQKPGIVMIKTVIVLSQENSNEEMRKKKLY